LREEIERNKDELVQKERFIDDVLRRISIYQQDEDTSLSDSLMSDEFKVGGEFNDETSKYSIVDNNSNIDNDASMSFAAIESASFSSVGIFESNKTYPASDFRWPPTSDRLMKEFEECNWPDDLPLWLVEYLSKDGKYDNQIKRIYTYYLADKLMTSVRDRHKLALKLGCIGTPTTPPTNNDIVFALGGNPVVVAEEMIEKCPVSAFTLVVLADKVNLEHKLARTSPYWYWPGCTYEEFMRACDRTNGHLYPGKGNIEKGDVLALEVEEMIDEDGIFRGFKSVRTDNKIIYTAHRYLCESTSSTYKHWADKGTELIAIEAGLEQYKKVFGHPLDYYPPKSWLDEMNIPEQSRSSMNVEANIAVVNDTSIQGQIGASEEGTTIEQDSREIQPENQGGHLGNVSDQESLVFNENHQNDDPPPLNQSSVNNNQLLRHQKARKIVYGGVGSNKYE
jgi:hypothetical protein